MKLKSLVEGLSTNIKRYSPEILTAIGVGGMVTTVVMAVKATPKAMDILKKEEEKKKEPLTKTEAVKAAWKCYIPTAVSGAVSIACVVGASSVHHTRNAALGAAYTLSETALKEYQEKAVDILGEKKERTIRDAVAKDKLEKNPVENREVVLTGVGNTLCYDSLSGRYFMSDMNRILTAKNDLNARMINETYVSLNDFYYEIGLNEINLGDELGWTLDEYGQGQIDLDFSSDVASNGVPCLVMCYKVAPKRNYSRFA